MKRLAVTILIAGTLGLSGPAAAQSAKQILKGTAIGAGGGAVAGAVIPGISTGEGALIGAAGGAAITALNHKDRRCYRDSRGRKYAINRNGSRNYRRC